MFHVKEIVSKFERDQWIHYERIRNHKERRGADDGLLLVRFNHIDRFSITDFHACVTEYATGDRYRYASEGVI